MSWQLDLSIQVLGQWEWGIKSYPVQVLTSGGRALPRLGVGHIRELCSDVVFVVRFVAGVRGADVGEDNPLLLVQEFPLVGLVEWPVLFLMLGADPGVDRAFLV